MPAAGKVTLRELSGGQRAVAAANASTILQRVRVLPHG